MSEMPDPRGPFPEGFLDNKVPMPVAPDARCSRCECLLDTHDRATGRCPPSLKDRKLEVTQIIEAAERRAVVQEPVERTPELDVQAQNMLNTIRDLGGRIRMAINTHMPPWTADDVRQTYTLRYSYDFTGQGAYKPAELTVPYAVVKNPDTWYMVIREQLVACAVKEINQTIERSRHPMSSAFKIV